MRILAPDEAGITGAVTLFSLRGKTGFEDNVALARRLADDYGILPWRARGSQVATASA